VPLSPPSRWPTHALLAVVGGCAVATVLVDAVAPADGPGVRVAYPEAGSSVMVAALVLAGCAWVVLRNLPRHRVGWVMAV
jgi:hypothetical protein